VEDLLVAFGGILLIWLIVAELLMRSLWILFSSGMEHSCKLRAFAIMEAKLLTRRNLIVYTYLRKYHSSFA